MIVSIPKGLLTNAFITIVLLLFGVSMLYMSVTQLYMLFPFAVLMILTALCFTGIEFNPNDKTYREYYRFVGIKFGKWKPYNDFSFISYHSVTLGSTVNLPNIPVDTGTHYEGVYKLFLLNETHTKKLFVKYVKRVIDTQNLAKHLSDNLKMEVVRFNPPMSQARLRRKK